MGARAHPAAALAIMRRVPAIRRPVVLVWLAAVATLGFRWLSPLAGFYERALLADALIAVATALWAWEVARGRRRPALAAWQGWLAAYVLAASASALAAADRETAIRNLVLVTELAAFAVISADLARDPQVQRALARVVLAAAFVTLGLTVVALALFYAGEWNALLGPYGEQLEPSDRYARVRAGFASAPLLASWCIAASAIVAWRAGGLPDRWRLAGQLALAIVVFATLSRGALAFCAALLIRWALGGPTPVRRRLAIAATLVLVVVLGALSFGRPQLDPTRPSSLSYEFPDPGNRREAITTAWDTFTAHPVLGSGPGSYPARNRGAPFRAHLTPLNVAATLGLPALVALAGMVVALWRGRSRPTDVAVWTGLVAVALDGLAQDVEHFRHVWLLVGLAGAGVLARGSPRRGAVSQRRSR